MMAALGLLVGDTWIYGWIYSWIYSWIQIGIHIWIRTRWLWAFGPVGACGLLSGPDSFCPRVGHAYTKKIDESRFGLKPIDFTAAT
jgi:hypothetical protein